MVFLAVASIARAHVVPNMTIEAEFDSAGGYTLRINVDPRTFLATDPTSLPPVPGSWYLEQTPEQVAATHEKAQQYLASSLGLLVDGKKASLPACKIQAMDGADNTPLTADTQEVHLLGTASGQLPAVSATFQIDFAKEANTSLILLHSQAGKTELRPQVVFPGETSRPFQLKLVAAAVAPEDTPASKANNIYLIITISVTCIVIITGWLLLSHYRHHHRAHRKPGAGKM
ncbi:hypothetical protein [Prosthecobacter sp.]|uniref:hypothetical protein n=1 Tax=Prosthecobacter sp. TaxID=1965333 RepID=UPI00248A3760|nr:hypothetical protein [Prosthecobacter sp.]MDI1311281.1 hypothetical protein [Prosthecobacter sp.]